MKRLTRDMNNPRRTALGALITGLGLVALLAPTSPASSDPAGKTTICHATGSLTKPYVQITISNDALAAHAAHQDGRDIIPAPPTGCEVFLPPTTTTTVVEPTTTTTVAEPPFILCVVSAGVQQTATTVTGTPADDTIDCSGASPGKTIDTFAGNDTITGTVFVDAITSGDGNDTVTSLDGDDVIDAGDGNNTVTGGLGDDTIRAGSGSDTLTGSEGNDFLDGSAGIDTISGGPGDDRLVGPNNDSSVDTVSGGDGVNDVCTGPGLDFDIVSGCETETP